MQILFIVLWKFVHKRRKSRVLTSTSTVRLETTTTKIGRVEGYLLILKRWLLTQRLRCGFVPKFWVSGIDSSNSSRARGMYHKCSLHRCALQEYGYTQTQQNNDAKDEKHRERAEKGRSRCTQLVVTKEVQFAKRSNNIMLASYKFVIKKIVDREIALTFLLTLR